MFIDFKGISKSGELNNKTAILNLMQVNIKSNTL